MSGHTMLMGSNVQDDMEMGVTVNISTSIYQEYHLYCYQKAIYAIYLLFFLEYVSSDIQWVKMIQTQILPTHTHCHVGLSHHTISASVV